MSRDLSAIDLADLVTLRRMANRGLQALLWLHVPLCIVVAASRGNDPIQAGIASAAMAVVASLSWMVLGVGQATLYDYRNIRSGVRQLLFPTCSTGDVASVTTWPDSPGRL